MSKLPTVAIIGRPNTGKSTLFNKLVGRRTAIESDVPGTTRDHISHVVETPSVDYLLIDTGGMGGGTQDKEIEDDVHTQSLIALAHSDLIIFTINAKEELTSSDREIVKLLRTKRRKHVPVILVLTKCDAVRDIEAELPQYRTLGIAQEIIATSGAHNMGTSDLRECIVRELSVLHFQKTTPEVVSPTSPPRIAIIGKPNVGKSSVVNAFMSDTERERSPRLVSDIPGTTRDATDTTIRHEGQEFIFVDTAGLRRHTKVERGIESFAMMRTIQSLEDCDIAVLMVSATEPLSHQDKRIAGLAIEHGKGLIILVNKIDLISTEEKQVKLAEIAAGLRFCRFAPVLPCSAETRVGLLKVFDLIAMVHRNIHRRISTKDLLNWFEDAIGNQPMSALTSCKLLTQAQDIPPTFTLFCRNPKQVQLSQLRYLENRLRETFDFQGTPVRWVTKRSGREKRA